MPLRPPAGYIRPGYDPLQVPNAPTIGTATAGAVDSAEASVTFTAPSNTGGAAITQYTAVSTPGGLFAQGSASPLTVTGLTNGTSYTFAVWALNTYGPSPYSAASGSVTPVASRGLFGGGYDVAGSNVIDYVTIASAGNATDFGDLTQSRSQLAGCSSSTRGLFGGGNSNGTIVNTIDYVVISSVGNATDFGDLTLARTALASCSNNTRGLWAGGNNSSDVKQNIIDYVTIASEGNATDFGDITYFGANAIRDRMAGCASSTRGLFGGGRDSSSGDSDYIFYVTIASVGNTTYFGNLTLARSYLAACSSSTRGVFAGGIAGSNSNVIDYVTIASTGNATDFGDLSGGMRGLAGTSSSTRGLFGGGVNSGGSSNIIEYITIASAGDAIDFGDLTVARQLISACSNAHGGL